LDNVIVKCILMIEYHLDSLFMNRDILKDCDKTYQRQKY